jgi:hypothetical protein|tara:strand:+ start:60 stop:563 length:504 start_codon:yes stop_codon:yes gene_type:complete
MNITKESEEMPNQATEYQNRYGDVYTFTKLEDGSVLWEGSFEHCRFGSSNDYKLAYETYCHDTGKVGDSPMHIEDFKEAIHESVYDENDRYVGPSVIGDKYQSMVKSNPWISMVDPSGGPFINEHSKLDIFGEELKGLCVQLFEPIETGYKIHTYGEFDHLRERTDD